MNDDIEFWTDRVIHSANNNDRSAFSKAMGALMRAVHEVVSSALRSASREEHTLHQTSADTPSKKKYNLPKAE